MAISISYPSSRSFLRSGLRLISRCDIENHALLHLHGFTRDQGPLWGMVSPAVGHGDFDVRSLGRVIVEGEVDDFLVGEALVLDLLGTAVHDDGDDLLVAGLVVLTHVDFLLLADPPTVHQP